MDNGMLSLGLGYIGAGVGAGLALVGAGIGIGKLAASALDGIARQPEAAGTIRTTMIIAAALIEGLAFFGLVICLMCALNISKPKPGEAGAPNAAAAAH